MLFLALAVELSFTAEVYYTDTILQCNFFWLLPHSHVTADPAPSHGHAQAPVLSMLPCSAQPAMQALAGHPSSFPHWSVHTKNIV